MQKIDLHDVITIQSSAARHHTVLVDDPSVPLNEENIVFKALRIWCEATYTHTFFAVKIQKRIPMAGGLGGGSTDAAAVLACLNEAADSEQRLPDTALLDLAARIGADVPFCLTGITALCTGIGEIMEPLPPLDPLPLLLITGETPVSTKKAFAVLDRQVSKRKHPDHLKIVSALRQKVPQEGLADNNHFLLNLKQTEDHKKITRILSRVTPLYAGLSGSGPTYFLIFDSVKARSFAKSACLSEFPEHRLIESTLARDV